MAEGLGQGGLAEAAGALQGGGDRQGRRGVLGGRGGQLLDHVVELFAVDEVAGMRGLAAVALRYRQSVPEIEEVAGDLRMSSNSLVEVIASPEETSGGVTPGFPGLVDRTGLGVAGEQEMDDVGLVLRG